MVLNSVPAKPVRIAISQPTYLPWLGYFDLMDQVDIFVLLDTVQFEKQSWQQRNRIKTATGLQWLTVPVKIKGRSLQRIEEVEIAERDYWKKHVNQLRGHYRSAKYFEEFFPQFQAVLAEGAEQGNLAELNIRLIEWFASILGVATRRVRSSSLGVEGKRSGLNLALCEALGGNSYYSALGSAVYLLADTEIFERRGLDIFFQNYRHPEYAQQFPPFLAFASVIDLIFNEGGRSMEIIRSGRGVPLSPAEAAARLSGSNATGSETVESKEAELK